jgi:hypothetical protein
MSDIEPEKRFDEKLKIQFMKSRSNPLDKSELLAILTARLAGCQHIQGCVRKSCW